MPIIKVTVFQKNLNEGLNINVMKKLVSIKSDFLVFPEYFYVDSNIKNYEEMKERSKNALDWLLKLNHSYKGIIIGGSIIKEEDGKLFNACPIIYNGEIVDWYYKQILTEKEQQYLTPGKEIKSFTLNQIRFSVLICKDIEERNFLDELKKENVKLIFVIVNSPAKEESTEEKYTRDQKLFLKPAKENQQVIVKCSAVGEILGTNLQGRSLLATPGGISWRVTPKEEKQQILKQLMIQI